MKLLRPFTLGLLFLSLLAYAGPKKTDPVQGGYDEVYDENGKPRGEYELFLGELETIPKSVQRSFTSESRKAFRGDNTLSLLPRIIHRKEFDGVLRAGVQQRANAIIAFLKDHYSGKKRYAKTGVISPEVLDRIIKRAGEQDFEGLVNPDRISFPYGPDILKDPEGTWRVIEDNPGYIGGIGDLPTARALTEGVFPNTMSHLKSRLPDPNDYYRDLIKRYKAKARQHGSSRVVLYLSPPYSDNEEYRIKKIFSDNGISIITPNTQEKIKVLPDGVYTYDSNLKNPKLEKVGFVVLYGEHKDIDPSHPIPLEKALLEEASNHLDDKTLNKGSREKITQALNTLDPKTGKPDLNEIMKALNESNLYNTVRDPLSHERNARGLVTAILDGQVGSNYSPGINFIGDKEFYIYIEDFIRFYLKQEPILKNIPTETFYDPETKRLNKLTLKRFLADPAKYVAKKVDDCGGDSVWVGPKLMAEEIKKVEEQIREKSEVFIDQEYTPLSQVGGDIVDLRVISEVDSEEGTLVSETGWGRGVQSEGGNGKVNIGSRGKEYTVLVIDDEKPRASAKCLKAFKN